MNLELIEALLRSVEGSAVTEIEYQADGHRLRIVRHHEGVDAAAASTNSPAATALGAQPPAAQREAVQTVCAPMHGTFYRSSAPGAPPIVEVGQQVEAGQQLALLEAMKMLHAVEAEYGGRITKILAENGVAVEPGTPLFEIETAETGGV